MPATVEEQSTMIGQRCDGVRRRTFLQIGLSAFGVGLAHRARAVASGASAAKAKSCILIWLDGGPSHLETFDLKPDAPNEVRGPFASVATAVPGVRISEHLPRTAKLMDRLAIVRSMTSPLGEHSLGSHYLLTGYQPNPALEYPSLGSVVSHVRGGAPVLPRYIAVPDANAYATAGYLPARDRPFIVGGDPARPDFKVQDLDLYPRVTIDRIERRREFLATLDRAEAKSQTEPDDRFAAAYRLLGSPEAKAAFDLTKETAATRERFGPRTLGQSCLLARRLVERGVPFVTVHNPGWDTHQDLATRLRDGYTGAKIGVGLIPTLDLALSGLVGDLRERGLLDSTLVVVMGEFGRTPKLNVSGGRDHWPRVFSVLLAGGGVRGGQVVGASDRVGESTADRPVTPADLAGTVFTLLGVDPRKELHTADGRPVAVNQGNVVAELLG